MKSQQILDNLATVIHELDDLPGIGQLLIEGKVFAAKINVNDENYIIVDFDDDMKYTEKEFMNKKRSLYQEMVHYGMFIDEKCYTN